jgi:RimJ/RimL family protein N-acetyltransferase
MNSESNRQLFPDSPFPESWPRPERRVFEGQTVTLMPLDALRDAEGLFAASHGTPEIESLWRYLPYGPFKSEEAYRNWLEEANSGDDPLFFTVCRQGLPVGVISILSIEPQDARAELGHIWYSPAVQRSKVNTESVYLLLCYLFDDLRYRRAEWKCNNKNEASRRAAQRMGFQYEGLFRQHRIIKGENRDTAWFSMLDSEWPQRKANFERWLYEDTSVSLSQLNNP